MTPEQAQTDLRIGEVARLLGMSDDTVRRIPEADLPYWLTPGLPTGKRRQRRYRRADVVNYARQHLGREIPDE
jgi:hypothetical protein